MKEDQAQGQSGTRGSIAASNLTKSFNQGKTRALDHLSMDVAQGDMTAITGPSGSGKSTLLYALSGLIALENGSVSISGRCPTSPSEWTQIRQSQIGLIFQDDWLLPTLTCAQNVELPMVGVIDDRKKRNDRVRHLLERVNAADLGNRKPKGLSGGERQRIAVARSLANSPDILLADEPTGELDSKNSQNIMSLLRSLRDRDNMTILIVTHDPTVAAACDRHFEMLDGQGAYINNPATRGAL